MFGFLKKIFGLPTAEEVKAAQETKVVPYKVEPPVINNKTGDVVDTPPLQASVEPDVVEAKSREELLASTSQITDAVTQAEPVKKTRKPRNSKAEKPVKEKKVVKEKATKARKPVAEKSTKRSKRA